MSHARETVGRPYAPEALPRKDEVGAEGIFALDLRVGRVVDVRLLQLAEGVVPGAPVA